MITLWQTYEGLYKRALLCHKSSYYHPESELIALKLAYKDRLCLDNPEQIDVCYQLAKRQRKFLTKEQNQLPSTKYLTIKTVNLISRNQSFLDYLRKHPKSYKTIEKI